MGYQFFLPMVLRWRASRAEAPLLSKGQFTVDAIETIKANVSQVVLRAIDDSDDDNEKEEEDDDNASEGDGIVQDV